MSVNVATAYFQEYISSWFSCFHRWLSRESKYLRFHVHVQLYELYLTTVTRGPHSSSSICPLWVHRVLQGEYRRLKWKHAEAASVPMLTEAGETGVGSAEGQQDEELLAEARALRQHKTRLETRMQILEDHNKQLESQLRRLRELLLQVERSGPWLTYWNHVIVMI